MKENQSKIKRLSGILLHPSALPNSPVCGSFGQPSRDWLHLLALNGVSIWQFLPLSPTDSSGSPYSSPSSFSVNPWFLDALDLVEDQFIPQDILNQLPGEELINENGFVDFKMANHRSNQLGRFLREAWCIQSDERHLEFANWCSEQSWLEDHACFMEIRKQNNELPWWLWPNDLALYKTSTISNWKLKNGNALLEHKLIQWHLSRQWNSICKLAKELGVELFGDLPFYVSRDSADVWSNQSLFSVNHDGSLSLQSGVPPDYFSETGQLWGTPVYRWKRHLSTGFRWWRNRFRRQWNQVDLLRLDHFRALEGFWAVSGDETTAQKGIWLPSPGLKLLNKVKKDYGNQLPLIAEDLGIITSDVNRLRSYFKLPGMKILQFAFDGNLDNPYLPENIHGSNWVVYTGTHDNPTTEEWWDELDDDMKSRVLSKTREDIAEPSWKLIELGLSTEASLFIAPLQDLMCLGASARFNTPGTINGNWSWRLDEFDSSLTDKVKRYADMAKSHQRD